MCNTFQLPNVLIDRWMSELSDSQFCVLMAIARFNLSADHDFRAASFQDIASVSDQDEVVINLSIQNLKRIGLVVSDGNGLYRLNIQQREGAI